MSISRIASRYAKSLMDLSIEQGNLDVILQDVEGFNASLKSRKLYLMLKSPIINTEKKQEIFDLIFKGKISELTMAFFTIIMKKGREEYLPEIAQEFIKQYKEYKGITTVVLTTASDLDEETLNQIKSRLMGSKLTHDKIDLVHQINADLIGGFIVELEDKLYDASAAHKLEQFRKSLLDNKYVASL